MAIQSGTAFNGPLKYRAHTLFPTNVNSPGGTTAQKAKYPYLTGAPLVGPGVDNLTLLAYQTPDDQPRCFGYAWNGTTFPGPYATTTTNEGIVATLTASTTATSVLGGGITITSSAGAPALNTYVSGAFFQVTAGKRMWYSIRFNLGAVTSTAVIVGFVNSFGGADLTTLPTEGIFFLKTLAGTDFSAIVRHSSTSTTVSSGCLAAVGDTTPLANSTNVDLGFLVDSGSDSGLLTNQGGISFYCNGKFVGQDASTDANIPTGLLSYAIAMNTTGGAQSMLVSQGLGMEEL